MLRSVFFNDVEEVRRRMIGDYVLVNYYNKMGKKWTVAVYHKKNYILYFPVKSKLQSHIEEVVLNVKGPKNLYPEVEKGAVS